MRADSPKSAACALCALDIPLRNNSYDCSVIKFDIHSRNCRHKMSWHRCSHSGPKCPPIESPVVHKWIAYNYIWQAKYLGTQVTSTTTSFSQGSFLGVASVSPWCFDCKYNCKKHYSENCFCSQVTIAYTIRMRIVCISIESFCKFVDHGRLVMSAVNSRLCCPNFHCLCRQIQHWQCHCKLSGLSRFVFFSFCTKRPGRNV